MIVKEGSKTFPPTIDVHDENHDSEWLETQKHIWMKEQELVASRIQVYSDPVIATISPSQENCDGNHSPSTTIVVEDTPWYTVLRQQPCDSDGNRNRYFGGVDVGFANPPTTGSPATDGSAHHEPPPAAVAVYVVIDATTMRTVYRDHAWIRARDLPPYVSGFLAFREILPLERLVRGQVDSNPAVTPAAILVDGNGIFHPRHAGLACFLGVRTGIPTIGIGKSLLYIEKHDQRGNSSDSDNNDDGTDEYQWTRGKLDARIDRVLASLHQRLVSCSDRNVETSGEEHRGVKRSANSCEDEKGLILPKGDHVDETIGGGPSAPPDHPGPASREELLEGLAPFCHGIAIPLEAPHRHHDDNSSSSSSSSKCLRGSTEAIADDDRFRVLGTALVGHGRAGERRFPQFSRSSSSVGKSTRPIIVSVGHKASTVEAASIAASLSVYRIPEPVRQADLYGRELLRQRKLL